MKCYIRGFLAFALCAVVATLFLPAVRKSRLSDDKRLPVRVLVVDTDEEKPIEGAEVTFFRAPGIENVAAQIEQVARQGLSGAVTGANGEATLTGTFRGWVNRGGGARWYRVDDTWLKVTARGRPTAFVPLDHHFGGERDYENDAPLDVVVVLNKAPVP
jgi:hypothetical protein